MDIILVSCKKVDGLENKKKSMTTGGWITGIIENILKYSDYKITVVSPDSKMKNKQINERIKINTYVLGSGDDELKAVLVASVKNCESPVILVFGTESKHQNKIIDLYTKLGYADKVIIWLQGIAAAVYNNYNGFLPDSVIDKRTLKEYILHNGPHYIKKALGECALLEAKSINTCKNIIGRTTWDYAWAKYINPNCTYFHCNETMRAPFYNAKWSYDECQKHTIFISQNNTPWKGYHYVLQAVAALKKEFPDVILSTTGRDFLHMKGISKLRLTSYEKYLIKEIKRLKIEDNVKFLGTLDGEKMCNAYAKSNVYVLGSSIENSPNSLCEAMLVGTPVVAADVGGAADLCTHKKDGYMYASADVPLMVHYIRELFLNREKAEEFSQNAREHARITNNEETNCKRLIEIFKTVAGE